MITIDRHIEYLLSRHDCVVVPGLGAFVTDYQPAHFEGSRFMPPSRVTGFNPDIRHNDGLLASSYSRLLKTTFEAASRAVADESASLRRQLDADGEITIQGVGRIEKTADGRLSFMPASIQASSLSLRGLPSFEALTLAELAEKEGRKEESKKEEPRKIVYIPITRRAFRAAASIAVILAVGLVCSTPRVADSTTENYASLSAPRITMQTTEATPEPQETVVEAVVEPTVTDGVIHELLIAIPSETEAAAPALAAEPAKATATAKTKSAKAAKKDFSPRINEGDPYCIVVASFTSRAQAERYIASAGNRNLRILEQDGRFRIYAATERSEDAAKALAWSTEMQKRYPGAWVTAR